MTETEQKLWYPGIDLETEYPTPESEELVSLWEGYAKVPSLAVEGVFGAYTPPESEVRAIVSFDMCEVVRDTIVAIDHATGLEPIRRNLYSEGTWFSAEKMGQDYERNVITSIARVLMDADLVEPADDIFDIALYMLKWREAGVYNIANTSTLPGCEPGTIRFLSENMPGCLQGILLPRNHDGKGRLTKAQSLSVWGDEAGIDVHAIPIVKIDDLPFHLNGFIEHFTDHEAMACFMPAHSDNVAPTEEMHCNNTLDAVKKTDDFLRNQGLEL